MTKHILTTVTFAPLCGGAAARAREDSDDTLMMQNSGDFIAQALPRVGCSQFKTLLGVIRGFAQNGHDLPLVIRCLPRMLSWTERVIRHKTAIFRQINQEHKAVHHDALEFPDGEIVLLTLLKEGQQATVLQLPASASVNSEQRANDQLSLSEPSAIVV